VCVPVHLPSPANLVLGGKRQAVCREVTPPRPFYVARLRQTQISRRAARRRRHSHTDKPPDAALPTSRDYATRARS
jgi:hypothetical protein